jgi:chromosome segregation ATPase
MTVHLPVDKYLETQSKVVSGNKYFDTQNKVGGTTSVKLEREEKEMQDKLTAHDYELKEIRNILGSVASSLKDTNVQVNKLTESINKLDVFLEKQTNMELRHSDSINRIHKRIDETEGHIKKFYEISGEYHLTKKDVDDIVGMKNKLILGVLGAIGMGLWQLLVR